jgi:adenosylcobinamide kinase/adenosylcobinamide-phosphate guanylyltransferase
VEVRLLGTGSADGWPNPWCTCASCSWARETGVTRTHTSVLVDDTLLIDFGPDVPRSASRSGVSLDRVRWLLLGHAHPDHTGPAALRWRSWASSPAAPLEVLGPPAAIAACRDFLGPGNDPGLAFREVLPGEEVERGPYRLRTWEAEHGAAEIRPSLLWDVERPATPGTPARRLLYGSDTLPLAGSALPRGPYDLVLLEETYGDGPPFGDHLGLTTFADTVAGLRRHGALRTDSRVVAVHLGHQNPPGDELRRRLELLGAEVHPDGTLLDLDDARPQPRPHLPRRVLITGGARSGKSEEAERRLRGEPCVVYAATAAEIPDDAEWTARLDAHRRRRPPHWQTVVTAGLAPLLDQAGPPLLVDDLGFWLTRAEETPDALVAAFRRTARPVVVVTAEVGSGVVPASSAGRAFRDDLGRLNARMAAEADEVWQCVAGLACRLK